MFDFNWIRDYFKPKVKPTFFATSGRITSYGYKGDSTPDTNSEHAIGAWDNHLQSGLSLAVSPDIEQQFKHLGVAKQTLVDIILKNGIVLTLRWDDRTSSKLSGRFDLFSPGGLSRYDGLSVIGIRRSV